jgi:acetyl esterase/lipase
MMPTARVPYGDWPDQFGDLWLPVEDDGRVPAPLVVALHGGYWRAEHDLRHLDPFCVALARGGLAVLSVEYRRIGARGGTLRAMLDDVRAAVSRAAQLASAFPVAARPPVLVGHSAGGHLALWVAKQVPVAGVVALAPISDLGAARDSGIGGGAAAALLATASEQEATAASPVACLPIGAKQIVIHGVADRGVPVAMSEAYAMKASAAGDDVTLHALPGVGHMDLIDPASDAFGQVLAATQTLAGRMA